MAMSIAAAAVSSDQTPLESFVDEVAFIQRGRNGLLDCVGMISLSEEGGLLIAGKALVETDDELVVVQLKYSEMERLKSGDVVLMMSSNASPEMCGNYRRSVTGFYRGVNHQDKVLSLSGFRDGGEDRVYPIYYLESVWLVLAGKDSGLVYN